MRYLWLIIIGLILLAYLGFSQVDDSLPRVDETGPPPTPAATIKVIEPARPHTQTRRAPAPSVSRGPAGDTYRNSTSVTRPAAERPVERPIVKPKVLPRLAEQPTVVGTAQPTPMPSQPAPVAEATTSSPPPTKSAVPPPTKLASTAAPPAEAPTEEVAPTESKGLIRSFFKKMAKTVKKIY